MELRLILKEVSRETKVGTIATLEDGTRGSSIKIIPWVVAVTTDLNLRTKAND